jgi:hypothetical protein
MKKYWAHLVISNDEEWEGDVYKVEEADAVMARLKKNEDDTGGGCSVCSTKPSVNVEGTYWLCGSCVNDLLAELRGIE